jgi:hypothetical protein
MKVIVDAALEYGHGAQRKMNERQAAPGVMGAIIAALQSILLKIGERLPLKYPSCDA